jgi:hypothetical protein
LLNAYTECSYHPSLLLGLLVFGYAVGASSSSLGAAAMALATFRIIDRVILDSAMRSPRTASSRKQAIAAGDVADRR